MWAQTRQTFGGASPLSQCCCFVTLISPGSLANAGDSLGIDTVFSGHPWSLRSMAFGGLVTSDNRRPGKPVMRFGPVTYKD